MSAHDVEAVDVLRGGRRRADESAAAGCDRSPQGRDQRVWARCPMSQTSRSPAPGRQTVAELVVSPDYRKEPWSSLIQHEARKCQAKKRTLARLAGDQLGELASEVETVDHAMAAIPQCEVKPVLLSQMRHLVKGKAYKTAPVVVNVAGPQLWKYVDHGGLEGDGGPVVGDVPETGTCPNSSRFPSTSRK